MAESRHDRLQRKITAILEWADSSSDYFDTGFIDSLERQLEKNGNLSDTQEAALDNIIERFRIED